jgi:hypothetical protein
MQLKSMVAWFPVTCPFNPFFDSFVFDTPRQISARRDAATPGHHVALDHGHGCP